MKYVIVARNRDKLWYISTNYNITRDLRNIKYFDSRRLARRFLIDSKFGGKHSIWKIIDENELDVLNIIDQ
jgi:hypothetical protein